MKRMSEGERYALREIAHSRVVKRAGELWPFRRVPDAVLDGRSVEYWWAPDIAHAYRLADGWWAMNSSDPAHKLEPCVGPFPSLEQAIAAHKVARDKWIEQCAHEDSEVTAESQTHAELREELQLP